MIFCMDSSKESDDSISADEYSHLTELLRGVSLPKEGKNKVVCQVCGKDDLKQITHSHLNIDGLTLEEYQKLYPDSPTISESTRKKLGESNKGKKNPNYGKTHSAKTKQKMSEALSGENNPMFGRTLSEESRKKMSDSRREGLRTGKIKPQHGGSWGNAGTRSDLNQFFRSGWEADYARFLNYNKEEWGYESQIFDLGFTTYLPDFMLKQGLRVIEVKGLMTTEAQLKIDLFQDLLHGPLNIEYNFILIDGERYKQLEKKYKHLIPEWETRKSQNIIRRFSGYIRGKRSKKASANLNKLLE